MKENARFKNSFYQELAEVADNILKADKCIILGDFNAKVSPIPFMKVS